MKWWWSTVFGPLLLSLLAFSVVLVSTLETHAFYADNEFQQTVAFSSQRRDSPEEFKEHILDLLGMEKPPPRSDQGLNNDRIASKFRNWHMSGIYRALGEDEDEDHLEAFSPAYKYLEKQQSSTESLKDDVLDITHADTIISFIPHVSSDMNGDILSFNLDDLPKDARLLAVELHIIFDSPTNLSSLTLWASNVQENINNMTISATTFGGNFVMNITDLFIDWLHGQGTPMLILQTVGERGRNSLSDVGKWDSFGVASFIGGTLSKHRRQRRDTSPEGDDDHPISMGSSARPDPLRDITYHRGCRKRMLYVSFTELGWEQWVIAPEGYQAYYCDGLCSFPLNNHMNASNHAIVQTLVHLMDPSRTGEAKCAPTALKSLKVLFVDNSKNVVLKNYQNMQVRECGCQ